MSQFLNDSVFWIDVDKIEPNPFQPRREFGEAEMQSLSDSIRQYGVLQALVVTRKEFEKPEGGMGVKYELIAGERRLRASKMAGLSQVPCLIKTGDDTDLMKLELSIIENLQREDLNPIDRARAFDRLANEFGFTHQLIAQKIGKSREYVSNSLRLLTLPSDMQDALSGGKITEGHARPLMMLNDRPDERGVLFKEIILKRLTVREAEGIARRIAYDKVRKKEHAIDPETIDLEEQLKEALGTRVHIERKEVGGKILIDFFSNEDLKSLIQILQQPTTNNLQPINPVKSSEAGILQKQDYLTGQATPDSDKTQNSEVNLTLEDDRSIDEKKKDEEDIYSIKNFTV